MPKLIQGAVRADGLYSLAADRCPPSAEGPAHFRTKYRADGRTSINVERRLGILSVARDIFIEEGFAASSMASIASRLGGSKGTLYTYFPSKEALFAEVVFQECSRKITVIFDSGWSSGPDVKTTLRNFGKQLIRVIFSEETVQFTRMIIAESSRRPELGAMFYEAGPGQSRLRLASYLAKQVHDGHLRSLPTEVLAQKFCDLCLNEFYMKRLMNLVPPPRDDEIDKIVETALWLISALFNIDGPEKNSADVWG